MPDPSTGGGAGTSEKADCDALDECCDQLVGDERTTCTASVAEQFRCGVVLDALKAQGFCSDDEPDTGPVLPSVELDGAWSTERVDSRSLAPSNNWFWEAAVGSCEGGAFVFYNYDSRIYASVFDGSWSEPVTIDENNDLVADARVNHVAPSCVASAVWLDREEGASPSAFSRVWGGNIYVPGSGWRSPAAGETSNGVSERPVDDSLRANVFDEEQVDIGFEHQLVAAANRRTLSSAGFDAPASAAPFSVGVFDLASLPDGRGAHFFLSIDTTPEPSLRQLMVAERSANDGSWAAPVTWVTLSDEIVGFVEAEPMQDRFFVSWGSETGEKWYSFYRFGQELDAPLPFPEDIPHEADFRVAGNADSAFIVWDEAATDGVLALWVLRSHGSTGFEDLTRVSWEHHGAHDFDVVVDDDGNATVVYQAEGGIFANRYTPTAGWSGPHELMETGLDPHASVDPIGIVTVVSTTLDVGGNATAVDASRFVPAP